MHRLKVLPLSIILVMSLSLAGLSFGVSAHPLAATAPSLGAAASFAVMGASAVTNTGASVLNADLGIWPNGLSSITGFPPGIVTGTIHAADAVAHQAQDDVTSAYNVLAIQACDFGPFGPTDLGGKTLIPGVYCYSSSAGLTGTLTLDAQGNPNAVWDFKIGSTLTTASGSSIVFINGASGPGCNVFWQITSSATIGTTSTFVGNIIALSSITVNTSANLTGRALARNGAVTLDTNSITPVACVAAPTAVPTTAVPSTVVPPTVVPPTTTLTPTTTPTKTTTAVIIPTTGTPTSTPTTTTTAVIIPTTGTPTTTTTQTAIAATSLPATQTVIAATQTAIAAIPLPTSGTPTTTPRPTRPPRDTATTAPTETLLPVVTALPSTGGAPIRNDNSPWSLAIAGFSAVALFLGFRAYRSNHLPRE